MKVLVFLVIFVVSISNNSVSSETNNATANLKIHSPQKNVTKTSSDPILFDTEGGHVQEDNNKKNTQNDSTAKIDDKVAPENKIIKPHVLPRKGAKLDKGPAKQNSTDEKKPKNVTLNISTDNSTVKVNSTSPPRVTKPTVTVLDASDESNDKELNKSAVPIREALLSVEDDHRNLVIPVAITVFALPLFVVLGWYALKHGREAWKNRHYRRMDFLLDGMYND